MLGDRVRALHPHVTPTKETKHGMLHPRRRGVIVRLADPRPVVPLAPATTARVIHRLAVPLALVAICGCSALSPFDNSGPVGQKALPDPTTLLVWQDTLAGSTARPLVVGDKVFVLSWDPHTVAALDRTTGTLLWKTPLPLSNPLQAGTGLAMAGGRLIVGDIDGFGLDPAVGTIMWHYVPTAGHNPGWWRLASDGTTAYFGGASGYVYAVDGATGAERWKAKIAANSEVGVYSPVFDHGVIYAGFTDFRTFSSAKVVGGVAAVDATSGRTLWTTLLPKPDSTVGSGTLGVVVSAGHVFAGSSDGTVYALDAVSGAVIQSVPRSQFIPMSPPPSNADQKTLAISGTTLLVGSLFGTVSAFSIADLHRLWMDYVQNSGSVDDMAADSTTVFISHVGGSVTALRLSDGQPLWRIGVAGYGANFSPIYGAPTPDGDRIFLGGPGGVYAMKRQ
jgi:outer membrane protein assembly factor BamB